MKSKLATTVVFAVAALSASGSFAYGSNDMNPDAFPALRASVSTQTREAVRNDYAKARADGTAPQYNVYGETVVATPAPSSGLSRADVRKAYAGALKAGELPVYNQYSEVVTKPARTVGRAHAESRAKASGNAAGGNANL